MTGLSSISPVAMLPAVTAAPITSAGRFSPPLGARGMAAAFPRYANCIQPIVPHCRIIWAWVSGFVALEASKQARNLVRFLVAALPIRFEECTHRVESLQLIKAAQRTRPILIH